MKRPGVSLTRRDLLGCIGGAAGALAVAGCGGRTPRAATPSATRCRRFSYGSGKDQYGELMLPHGRVRGTVVLLHGGYWLPGYPAEQMHPLADALARRGLATWNLEYRRLQGGGGYPATLEDVAAGMDRLTRIGRPDLTRTVVLLGHSAGGQLAVWAASRTSATPGGEPALRPRAVVSLSGVLDLTGGSEEALGNGVIEEYLGGSPAQAPRAYELADPTRLVPCPAPVYAVQAADDRVVPASQAEAYVAADRAAGGRAAVVSVPGGHLDLIRPDGPAWPRILRILERYRD